MSQDASGASAGASADSYHILQYDPSVAGAVVVGVVYVLIAAASYWHIHRRRTWYLLALPIGALFSAAGWFVRLGIKSSPSSVPIFAVQQLFIVCAPAAFFAFNYVSYGRYIAFQRSKLEPRDHVAPQLSLLPERLTGRIFITIDVVTFLVQGAGGGMQSTGGLQSEGDTVFLIGIVVQGVGYILFTLTAILAHYRLTRWRHDSKAGRNFFSLIYLSSAFIWTRVVFRTIEAVQGFDGYLFQHELFLFVLDALMLILAMGIYLLPRCWLARFWLDNPHSITSGRPAHSRLVSPSSSQSSQETHEMKHDSRYA